MKSLQSALRTKRVRLALLLFAGSWPFLAAGQEREPAKSAPPQKQDVLTSKPRQTEAPAAAVKIGDDIVTQAGQRRRLQLADGSILFVNQHTEAKLTEAGRLSLKAGEIYVESAPAKALAVLTPHGELTGGGSHFSVRVDTTDTHILVARGSVQCKGDFDAVSAGQRLSIGKQVVFRTAPTSVSQMLDWTRELMLAAESPLIPGSAYAGGSLVALDPNGQEAKLELRKFHIDVFIEDGFARTTIDQTYFNSQAEQLEGTFYFPLPPDASLSRLAMYVDGVLREGGMAERDHARQTYESIRYYNRDPALLEWVDGSTFKMRVFPIEARQEKRLVLSYSQWLPSLNGQMQYRFPAGHSLQTVRDLSFRARIKNGKDLAWSSASHTLEAAIINVQDLELSTALKNARTDRDVVVTLQEKARTDGKVPEPRCATTALDGERYLMIRHRPDIDALPRMPGGKLKASNWVFLCEASGDRDPLLARVQIDVIRHLLHHAGPDDHFTVLTAGTRVKALSRELLPMTPENVQSALEFLESAHLVGALDLGQAFAEAGRLLQKTDHAYLVHLGSGIAAMGERRPQELIAAFRTGKDVPYVGIGVGRRWDRSFMKTAAERTGGLFTRINPDEEIPWRTFELFANLQMKRLLNVAVHGQAGASAAGVPFHVLSQSVSQGEEICAIARLKGDQLPKEVVITAQLDGKPWTATVPVKNVAKKADYLPRIWAKLEIDRLLADDALKNKDAIIALSKAMVVMTPFTSLLVLENDDQHAQYKIDFGRKDHWAMYPCPKKIDVVYEPLEGMPDPKSAAGKKPTARQVLRTLALGGDEPRGVLPDHYNQFAGAIPFDEYRSTQLGRLRREVQRGVVDSQVFDEAAARLAPPPGSPTGVPILANLGLGRVLSGRPRVHDHDGYVQTSSGTMHQQAYASPLKFRRAGQDLRLEFAGQNFATSGSFATAPASLAAPVVPLVSPAPGYDYLHELARPVASPWSGTPFGNQLVVLASGGNLAAKLSEMSFGNELIFSLGSNPLVDRIGRSNDWLYQRPRFNVPASTFFNLVAYAPGMANSLADIEAVIEAEARPTIAARPGKIDPAARDLFTGARAFGWQSWKLPGDKGQPAMTILFDGSGKYVYENGETASLRETVTCDGQTLLHLYPGLGIGAQRSVSRFHRAHFADAVPWALPEPADLAHGADLKLVAERTVAVIGHQEELWTKEIADKKIDNVYWLRVHLVFGADGKLAERQLIKMPKNDIVSRRIVGSDGVIKLVDGKGKELAIIKGELSPATAPNLTPDTKELVVLPLPYRTAAHVMESMNDKSLGNMRFKDALPLFAAHVAAGDATNANNVFRQVFHSREQRQLGFYVLLAGCGLNLDSQHGDVLAEHLENPLAQYLALHSSPVLRKHASQWAITSEQWKDSALQHLGQTHAILQRWESDNVLKGDPAKVAAEKRRALDYVKKHKETSFAWALLCLMQDRADQAPGNEPAAPAKDTAYEPAAQARVEFQLALAECWDLFKDMPSLKYAARYERARSLFQAGKVAQAREAFGQLYQATLKDNLLPPIDNDFRRCLQVSGPDDPWSKLISETARHLRDKKQLQGKQQRPMILALAQQVWRIEDQPLAENLLTMLLEPTAAAAKKEEGQRAAVTLAVVEFYQERGQIPQADELLQTLLSDPKQAERADLWRLAATLADQRDMPARGIECLEHALDLEFRQRQKPQGEVLRTLGVIDLQQVRADHAKLLRHYQTLADAMVALKLPPPDGFLAKVVRTADRWRALDLESPNVCSMTADILQRLGQRELGWDYLTTPIGMQPNESSSWWGLAGNLNKKGELKLADRAYLAAFEAEPTNAQILWDRAQNLRQAGEEQAAQRLYRQLADGTWQPRFQGLQTQARSRLKGS